MLRQFVARDVSDGLEVKERVWGLVRSCGSLKGYREEVDGLRYVAVAWPKSTYRKHVRALRVPDLVTLKVSVRDCCSGGRAWAS